MLPEFADEVALVVVFVTCLIFAPLLFFSQQLVGATKKGLCRYGRLADRYVGDLDRKWLSGAAPLRNRSLAARTLGPWLIWVVPTKSSKAFASHPSRWLR